MRMSYSVAVTGASGYAGGEFLRLAAAHPELTIGALTANSSAGTKLGDHHPHIRSLADRVIEPTTPQRLAEHDIVVLALPHGTSGPIADQLPADTIVVDLGADHRLERAGDWQEYYGGDHPGTWPYGMPELIRAATASKQRESLTGVRRIAVPGCNVTAVSLGLQPGIATGIADPTDIVAVLAVGYSGAGKAAKPNLMAAEALGSAAPYAVGGTHRHIPEIAQNLRAAGAAEVSLSFTPVLVPMSRGILATSTAKLAPGADPVTTAQLHAIWSAAYQDEPFVQVLPPGQWPTTAMTLGANTALTQVAFDQRAQRIVTVTAIDNLVKGTAGGAIQSLNVALGLPETLGLMTDGVAP
ncbi:N-acetyl-gamma-glutamyl-phosphate reductase [Rarobacter incanus]|uniref:N-acetyl-gamma-glutamyl-phosphate reductase n=1 Tax=Rarobacter incanus TaxID=153494 RepID=A0A542SLT2_9MICO|nr:N-acetyl-gamma-glutamyl-phosphate reductase [Rarobacter incanus]TQK75528.1 N-acetyl-gamma-glutamyl-phosphate reductase [Rarobacter incanus]